MNAYDGDAPREAPHGGRERRLFPRVYRCVAEHVTRETTCATRRRATAPRRAPRARAARRATRGCARRSWRNRYPDRRGSTRRGSRRRSRRRLGRAARRRPRARRRGSRASACIVRGVPRVCITTNIAPALGDQRQHRRVGGPARDVVDDARAGLDCRGRDLGLGGVDAHGDVRSAPPTPARRARSERTSSAALDRLGARPGGLAADVEHGGAGGGQLQAVRDRELRIEVAAAVGERVRSDVDDAHERSSGQLGDGA